MTQSTASQTDWKELFTKADTSLELYFGKKAPQLPDNIKEAIVKYSPYISAVVIILSVPAILTAFRLLSYANTITSVFGAGPSPLTSVTLLLSIGSVVVSALAIPGLFKRALSAWKLVLYSSLISMVSQLVSGNLIGLIISGLISFYFLYQIKGYYQN